MEGRFGKARSTAILESISGTAVGEAAGVSAGAAVASPACGPDVPGDAVGEATGVGKGLEAGWLARAGVGVEVESGVGRWPVAGEVALGPPSAHDAATKMTTMPVISRGPSRLNKEISTLRTPPNTRLT